MKTKLKQLAVAVGATAAIACSLSAQASLQGLPGEAQLIPFAYANSSDPSLGGDAVNTIMRFVVPRSVGTDTFIQFTAPHVMQGGQFSTQPSGSQGTNSPGLATLSSGITPPNYMHWTLLDRRSQHVIDGLTPVTADDVEVIDMADVLSQIGSSADIGYFVVTTEAGFQGGNADFAFFADAYLTLSENDVLEDVLTLPTLPLSDGADTAGQGPTLFNETVELNLLQPRVSPIASGIRTSGQNQYRAIDLTLMAPNVTGTPLLTSNATLLVFWNDRNLDTAGVQQAYLYDADEEYYSRNVNMPNELSTGLVRYGSNGSACAPVFPSVTPSKCLLAAVDQGPISTPNKYGLNFIAPALAPEVEVLGDADPSDIPGIQGSGFYKVFIPRPAGSSTTASNSAMYSFSLGLTQTAQGVFDAYSEVWAPHDRGTFTAIGQ